MALHIARARLTVDSRDYQGLFTLGAIARTQGRLGDASGWLEQAARVRPNDLPTAQLLGEVYLLSGELDRSAAEFQRVLAIDPNQIGAIVGLGWLASYRGDLAEAARLWRPVIARTRDGATLRRMTEVYVRVGDPAGAAEARAALARLRP
jgi:cytochrome c-type biogenesis protein CcmH/NrfG